MALNPKIPTTENPKFIHPVHRQHTNAYDLDLVIGTNEQYTVVDDVKFENTVTIYGEMLVFSPTAVEPAIIHNNLGGLQGGTTDEYYHLTNTQHAQLTSINKSILNQQLHGVR